MKPDWFQILSNLAIVAGLIILVYEVKQSNFHAQMGLENTNWEIWVNRELTTVGERPAAVLAKAIESPDQLTLEETIIIDSYHQNALAQIWQPAYNSQFGLAPELWKEDSAWIAKFYFGYPLGRHWWSVHRSVVDENVRRIVDQTLEEEPNFRVKYFQSMRGRK